MGGWAGRERALLTAPGRTPPDPAQADVKPAPPPALTKSQSESGPIAGAAFQKGCPGSTRGARVAGLQGNRGRKWAQYMCLGAAAGIIAAILLWPSLIRAANPAQLCDIAARNAAQRHGVPLDVLRAITLTETGRRRNGRMEPWPWALNMGGPGFWPYSRTAALSLARAQIDQGRHNIDLGCFQVNYHWHGHNFATLDAMIDPETNADYAARLLRRHHARLGSWEAAAGAYHSATPTLAARYITRFRALRGSSAPETPQIAAIRENRYSLLQPGGAQRMGSLVPIATSAAQPLIRLSASQ